MSTGSGSVGAPLLLACLLPWLAPAARADPPAGGQHTLQSCAAISAPAERLACYDALAQREAAGPPAAAAGPAASAAAVPGPPTPPVPVAAGSPPAVAAQPTAAPVGGVNPAGAEGTAAPAPGLTPQQAFGLYNAEHVSITSKIQSLTARVVGVHTGVRGYPVVDLDGGQSWALDDPDPLLAAGDTVTIRRASFDSFLLTTPSRRVHRAQRLR